MDVHLPLRALSDEEVRVHAQRLYDAACGFCGGPAVWVVSRQPLVAGVGLALGLSHALGCFAPARVRLWALECAAAAGKVGARGAVRALCELARRARRGGYAAPEGTSGSRDPEVPRKCLGDLQ